MGLLFHKRTPELQEYSSQSRKLVGYILSRKEVKQGYKHSKPMAQGHTFFSKTTLLKGVIFPSTVLVTGEISVQISEKQWETLLIQTLLTKL